MQGPSRRKYGQYREGKEAHEGLGKIFQKGGGGPWGQYRGAQEGSGKDLRKGPWKAFRGMKVQKSFMDAFYKSFQCFWQGARKVEIHTKMGCR